MEGIWERRRCQLSAVSELETDSVEWNSLEAEFMGDQGLTAGCSAGGGVE